MAHDDERDELELDQPRSDRWRGPSCVGHRPDRFEHVVAIAVLDEFRQRDPELIEPEIRKLARDELKPLRLQVGQRPKNHAVHDAEDRAIGPNPQRQREHHDGRETGLPAQGAEGVKQVFGHGGLDGNRSGLVEAAGW